jgi:hypothetical protein
VAGRLREAKIEDVVSFARGGSPQKYAAVCVRAAENKFHDLVGLSMVWRRAAARGKHAAIYQRYAVTYGSVVTTSSGRQTASPCSTIYHITLKKQLVCMYILIWHSSRRACAFRFHPPDFPDRSHTAVKHPKSNAGIFMVCMQDTTDTREMNTRASGGGANAAAKVRVHDPYATPGATVTSCARSQFSTPLHFVLFSFFFLFRTCD